MRKTDESNCAPDAKARKSAEKFRPLKEKQGILSAQRHRVIMQAADSSHLHDEACMTLNGRDHSPFLTVGYAPHGAPIARKCRRRLPVILSAKKPFAAGISARPKRTSCLKIRIGAPSERPEAAR